MADTYDLTIKRGNNVPIAWRGKDGTGAVLPLAGSRFILTIACGGSNLTTIRKDSQTDAGLVVDLTANTVTWTPTLEESRLIPLGKVSPYELERRIGGSQRTWCEGRITGVGGLGDD